MLSSLFSVFFSAPPYTVASQKTNNWKTCELGMISYLKWSTAMKILCKIVAAKFESEDFIIKYLKKVKSYTCRNEKRNRLIEAMENKPRWMTNKLKALNMP